MRLLKYFATLRASKIVLWCYLLWYLTNAIALFDPTPAIWLNSAGISLLIGMALLLSVQGNRPATGFSWQTFRLFMMPFGVSSFSTLIKGQGYFLIFPSQPALLIRSVLVCAAFILLCACLRVAWSRIHEPGGNNASGPA